jgi:hypothetical protein
MSPNWLSTPPAPHAARPRADGLLPPGDEAKCCGLRAVSNYLAARAAEQMSAWAGPRALAMGDRVAGHIARLTA